MASSSKWYRRARLLIIPMIVIAVIASPFVGYHYYIKRRDAPVVNPHPSQFITLYGTVDPDFLVRVSAEYMTTNPSCNIAINRLEGVYGSQDKSIYYVVKADDKNQYRIKIPLDSLQSGYCHWVFAGIDSHVSKKSDPDQVSSGSILNFFGKNLKTVNNGYLEVACEKADPATYTGFGCSFGKRNFDNGNVSTGTKKLNIDFVWNGGK